MSRYKVRYSIICGKELSRYQLNYCGPVCAVAADARRRFEWAKMLDIKQLQHWYRN